MRTMRYTFWMLFGVSIMIGIGVNATASTYTIPPEKVDAQKVFYGVPSGFEKAAKVDYETIIKATPEYTEVKKNKLEPGTGKYWILLSKASDRAVRAISDVGQETGYDFIAAQAYLGSLEPTIPSEDITQLVVDKIVKFVKKDEGKEKKR